MYCFNIQTLSHLFKTGGVLVNQGNVEPLFGQAVCQYPAYLASPQNQDLHLLNLSQLAVVKAIGWTITGQNLPAEFRGPAEGKINPFNDRVSPFVQKLLYDQIVLLVKNRACYVQEITAAPERLPQILKKLDLNFGF